MPARVFVHLRIVISKSALFVGQCSVDQSFELLNAERLEPKDLRARDERAVHIEKRIVGGRANQAEISSFDIGQENILLRFVEVVDLVDEQDRLLSRCAATIRRRGDYAAHLGNVTFDAADSN